MSTKLWRGDAVPVAQVTTATPANVEIGDTFSLSINGKTVSFVATAATAANVTAGLTAAWNASTVPEHAEITASDQTTFVRLTADAPGKPFSVTASTTNGGASNTQTLTLAASVASAGPNHYDSPANWSPSGVPANNDDLVFQNNAVDCLYGLDQNAITIKSIRVDLSYTGKLGLPILNSGGYYEYRQQYLKIGGVAAGVVLTLGLGQGGGSPRLKFDFQTAKIQAANIYGAGSSAEAGVEPILIKGSNSTSILNLFKGSVGVAVFAGETVEGVFTAETAQFAAVNVGFVSNVAGDSSVRFGAGATLAAINQTGGVIETNSALTTVTQTAGIHAHLSGAVTTLNLDGGSFHHAGVGTISLANVGEGGTLDFSRDMQARVVTAVNVFSGGKIVDPFRSVTWSNGVDLERCSLADCPGMDLGTHVKLTPGAPT